MPDRHRAIRLRTTTLVVLLACARAAVAADAAAPMTRSQNVTINLINRLVQRGVLPQSDADELIKMAEEDAAAAKAAAPAAPGTTGAPVAAPDDTVRVTYVPEFIKKQIREEVKQDVMAQAREERWAAPRSLPEWVSRYTFFGDFRLRAEALFYPSGNDNTGAFPNFNSINTGSPFDVAGSVFSPQYNVDQNRKRERIRVRIGADADMGEGFLAGVRLATGENGSPVTTNQTLGASGGDFSRYPIWLDRAFVKYRTDDWSVSLGRFENPFFASTMIFDQNLGFDGTVAQGKIDLGEKVKPFITVGAFPVFNSSLNFSTIQPTKFKSEDKWLFGGQVGTDWSIRHDLSAKFGASYYYFYNVEGRLSSPFTPLNAQDNGDTDETRPSFAQTGNTYFPLRNIVPSVLNNFGTINQFQYFGLATPFHEAALTGRIDYDRFEPVRLTFTAEWVNNLAFHRGSIRKKAVNNLGPGGVGDFAGGNNGVNLEFKVGSAALSKRWDWQTSLGYRYLESDATVDGFNDSDFGNGGTNLKGYTLAGAVALSQRTSLAFHWFSADNVAGPRYKNDYLQVDFNGKF